MDTDEITTCFHHTDREAGRQCTRCGRPACGDCLTPAPVGSHCFECVRAARPPAKERLRRWNATAGPLVTKILIAANVAVYLLTMASRAAEGRLVLFGPFVQDGELYRFGEILENAIGRWRFALLYAAALLGGSFGALLLSPHASTAGASGAVFGLMGAVAVGLRQRGIGWQEGGVGGLIAINLVLSVVLPGISLGGHVGGLLAGGAVGAVMLHERPSDVHHLESIAVALGVMALAVMGCIAVAGR
jgi:membrane associated rhomboid family serine protease